MSRPLQILTPDQVRHFLDRGYVTLSGCFSEEWARPFRERAWQRLGYDPADPATWEREIAYLDHETSFRVGEVAPRAWAAICDVVGGEERIDPAAHYIESRHFSRIQSFHWSDAFIINFRYGAERPWQGPSVQTKGWHKDGSYFRHFLDSPEQALLTAVLWSDTPPCSGGTFVACDSVKHVARLLADHPEGVQPGAFGALVEKCCDFVELTGRTGDLTILHPFALHCSSPNPSGRPRFMSNPPVILREPLRFDREDASEFSLVERAVLEGLGVERLAFRPAAPREWYGLRKPERG